MLFLLSPAKSLDYETPTPDGLVPTSPQFADHAAELIELLKRQTPAQVAELMDLSEALAQLNVGRYAAWKRRHTAHNSKPAVLAFDGDVYGGLQATTLDADDLAWAQQHLAILSGLYGVLRPLDRLQPYRLEMGTALANPRGKDLYAWWGTTIAEHLNARLRGKRSPLIVNLASQEYFRAVDRKLLRPRVVECVFEEWHNGAWKIISFHAKRARGLMARHAIRERASSVAALERFGDEGYAFDPAASEPDRLVFRRRSAPLAS